MRANPSSVLVCVCVSSLAACAPAPTPPPDRASALAMPPPRAAPSTPPTGPSTSAPLEAAGQVTNGEDGAPAEAGSREAGPREAGRAAPDPSRRASHDPLGRAIVDRGVADLRLDQPLPPMLRDRALLERTYVTTYYSDAQPLEGFALDDPKVTVIVRGAFSKWGMDHLSTSPPPWVKKQTIERVLAGGLPIDMMIASDDALATDRGLAVGDTLERFHGLYPGVVVGPFPALWEEPTCMGTVGHLAFFFACMRDDAGGLSPAAKLLRIVVYVPREERKGH